MMAQNANLNSGHERIIDLLSEIMGECAEMGDAGVPACVAACLSLADIIGEVAPDSLSQVMSGLLRIAIQTRGAPHGETLQ